MAGTDEEQLAGEALDADEHRGRVSLAPVFVLALSACGLGLYWAWLMLSFYADPTTQANVDNAWLFGAGGHSIALGFVLFGSKKLHSFIKRYDVMLASGALVSLGTLLPLVNWNLLVNNDILAFVIVCSGWLMTGIGTAALVVVWGTCFISFTGKQVLAVNAFALMEACLVHLLVFSSAPSIFSFVVIVLPCGSALLLAVVSKRSAYSVDGNKAALPDWSGKTIAHFSPRTLIPLGTLFFFAFCGELLRSAASDDVGLTDMGLLYDLGLFTGASVVLLGELVLRWRASEYPSLLGRLRILFLVMAFSFMVSTVFDMSFGFAYLCYAIGFAGLRIYAWVMAIELVQTLRISAFRVIAAMILSCSLGPLLAPLLELVVSINSNLWNDVSLVLVFGVLVAATELLNQNNYQDAWGFASANIILEGEKSRLRHGGATVSDEGERITRMETQFDELGLTPREREVARLLATGRSLPYVARSLCVSLSTAQTHQRHIYEKAGVHDRNAFLDIVEKSQLEDVSLDSNDAEKPPHSA